MNDILKELEKTISKLKENAPPKTEIWETKLVPPYDENGNICYFKFDIKEINSYFSVPFFHQYLTTITDAEIVWMINPIALQELKFEAMKNELHPFQSFNSIAGIPIFDDEYRSQYFSQSKETHPMP